MCAADGTRSVGFSQTGDGQAIDVVRIHGSAKWGHGAVDAMIPRGAGRAFPDEIDQVTSFRMAWGSSVTRLIAES